MYDVQKAGDKLELSLQILEIYNEQVRDLLEGTNVVTRKTAAGSAGPAGNLASAGTAGTGAIKIVSNSNGVTSQICTTNTSIMDIDPSRCIVHLNEAFTLAKKLRVTQATNVHDRSSRSHMVITLYIKRFEAKTGEIVNAGKLNLVDLAGSERTKKSEATGERMKEAQFINKSLSALQDVIWAHERKVSYVPYRNSKLTHLLQDSLGGSTTRCVMFFCCSITQNEATESFQTLQFAQRVNSVGFQMSS